VDADQMRAATAAIRESAQRLDRDLNAMIDAFRRETGCEIPVAEMVPVKDGYVLKFKVTV
jgi:RIO-like serine/threonine protein kinase